jgi:transcriptional regulator with XRE-family HTH domain
VRARRMAAGLTQKGLARICNVGAQFICEIERGQTNPSLETVALLANGLGCHPVELLASKSASVLLSRDLERARDAVRVLSSVLTTEARSEK